jgi:hypothetical protein
LAVRRPKHKDWQTALYNGKYKAHVLKFQVVCDFQGRPLFLSGPHAGVRSDIRLWRQYGPAPTNGENVLGDKAYVSKDVSSVLAPYKKKDGQDLSLPEHDFNLIHR